LAPAPRGTSPVGSPRRYGGFRVAFCTHPEDHICGDAYSGSLAQHHRVPEMGPAGVFRQTAVASVPGERFETAQDWQWNHPTGPVAIHPRRPFAAVLLISTSKSSRHQTLGSAGGPRIAPPIVCRRWVLLGSFAKWLSRRFLASGVARRDFP